MQHHSQQQHGQPLLRNCQCGLLLAVVLGLPWQLGSVAMGAILLEYPLRAYVLLADPVRLHRPARQEPPS